MTVGGTGGVPGNSRRLLGLVLLLALVSSTLFQGTRGLYETTEGRYAECARETLHAHEWDDPVLNGEAHWTKPPLTYMAIMAGLVVFGENNWGVRAYLVVAFVLTVMAVGALGSLMWGPRAAPFCAMVYATGPFTLITAGMASTDVLLTLFEALGILCFWLAVRRKSRLWIALMWVAFALAFMTKGPPALLPLLGISISARVIRREEPEVPHLLNPLGLALFLFVGFAWYVAEGTEHEGLMRYWLMHETIGRNLHGEFNRNPQFYKALVIYLPLVLFGTGPWAVLAFVKRKAFPWPSARLREWRRWPHAYEWFYLAMALVLPLTVLSLSTSKLALYALPLFVPISLSLGKGVQWLVDNGRVSTKVVVWLAVSAAVLFTAGKAIAARVENPSDMAQLASKVRPLLAQHPGQQLCSIKPVPLNGLEFYLDTLVPNYLPEDAAKVLEERGQVLENRIILVEKGDLHKLPQAPLTRFQQEPLGRFWVVLVAKPAS